MSTSLQKLHKNTHLVWICLESLKTLVGVHSKKPLPKPNFNCFSSKLLKIPNLTPPTNQRTNRPSDIVLAVLESQASIPKRTLQCLGSRRMAMAASHGKCEADEKFHMSRFVILFRMNLSYVWRIFNCFLCFNSCSKDLLLYGFLVEYVEVEVEMDSISDVSFWAPLVPIAHEIIAMMLTMMVATMNAEMMVPNV